MSGDESIYKWYTQTGQQYFDNKIIHNDVVPNWIGLMRCLVAHDIEKLRSIATETPSTVNVMVSIQRSAWVYECWICIIIQISNSFRCHLNQCENDYG